MSRKTDMIRDLKEFVGGGSFCSRKQAAAFMGYKDPHYVDPYLADLPRNGKRYYIRDVAEKIADSSGWR